MQFATTGILAKTIGCRATVSIVWRSVSLVGQVLSASRQYKCAQSGACDSLLGADVGQPEDSLTVLCPFGDDQHATYIPVGISVWKISLLNN